MNSTRNHSHTASVTDRENRAAADLAFQAPPALVDIAETARAALTHAETICRQWLPDGRRQGHEYLACNPTRQDARPGSFSINLDSGQWSDFATGDKGGDLVALVAYLDRMPTQGEAARHLAGWLGTAPAEIKPTNGAPRPSTLDGFSTKPERHPQLGVPSATWEYRNSDGQVIAAVCRFDATDARGKEYRPLALIDARWHWKAPPDPRPLYGLDRLAARPEAPVIVCEGEKAADAAGFLLPDMVAVASMNGAQSARKTDWTPLAGRAVHIWPDADRPGDQYAADVRHLAIKAGAASVRILGLAETFADRPPPPDSGWDAADFLAEWERPAAAPRWLVDHARWTEWKPAPLETERQRQARPAAPAEPAPAARPRQAPHPQAARAPHGWKLTKNMTFEVKEKTEGPEYIPTCGPIWIVGRTISAHGQWGLVLAFTDHDGREQRLAIPAARLHADPAALVGELSEMGLKTMPGREKKTLAYLAAWEVEDRILSAKRLGWMEDPSGALAFIMPDRVLNHNGGADVVFQPDRYAPTIKTVHAAGSLADWTAAVAARVVDHDLMLFSLCAGLAPAILAFGEAGDSFIVHFWGNTTRGKTTLGQIAASPWGCAADPNDAPSLTFIRRWNLTGNGLEGLAEAHSDLPLILDELGACTTGDIRPLVYALSGGQGKTALNSAREMKEPRAWRTVGISTGEVSLHARMSDPDGSGTKTRPIKAGLSHRALDIEVSDIAAAAPPEDRERLVSSIKVACARNYGTAGPALVAALAARFQTLAAARAAVRGLVDRIAPEIAPPGTLPQETQRAVRRFALIAAAGMLASDAGLIPADRARILAAARAAVLGWHGADGQTDDDRIVASVRAFILRHGARFQRAPSGYAETDPVRDRVGWYNAADDLWHFTDEGLIEGAPGNDLRTIARALRKHGVLFMNETDHLRAKVNFDVEGKRPRMFTVKGAIIENEKTDTLSKKPGQPGQPGQDQQPRGFAAVPVAETAPGQPGRKTGTDGPDPVSVPVVPVAETAPGQPGRQQPRGFVPPVPLVPVKNRDTGKNSADDADWEVFE